MVSSERKLASAVVGKSARACDNCIKKRARWYCAADDAFLCQSCDSSVHSANPLAKRHERVRLKMTTFKSFNDVYDDDDDEKTPKSSKFVPTTTWHHRKTRSPRQKKVGKLCFSNNLVPENCSEDFSPKSNDEQLQFRVPIFNPFVAELCNNSSNSSDFMQESSDLHGFLLPSEMDFDEFENLLGKGLDDESFDMEGLGILDCEHGIEKDCFLGNERVLKFELDDEEVNGDDDFEFNFDYDSPITGELEENVVNNAQISNGEPNLMMMMNSNSGYCKELVDDDSKKKIFLRLDYDSVLSAWDDKKSPWTTGERPKLDSGDCWQPNCMGSCGTSMHVYGTMGMTSGHSAVMMDGAREARVSRYREKRQKRLFSKKIRYEVRKLNAQKRPRMKGRFVKRSNLVTSALPLIKT